MKFRILKDFHGYYLQYWKEAIIKSFSGWKTVQTYSGTREGSWDRVFKTEYEARKHADDMVAMQQKRFIIDEFEINEEKQTANN